MKITVKLIIVLVIVIVFTVSVSVFLVEYFRKAQMDVVSGHMATIAGELMKRINFNLRVIIEDLDLYSLDTTLVRVLDEVGNTARPASDERIVLMKKLKERFIVYWSRSKGYNLFDSVHVIAPDGVIVSSTDESAIDTKIDASTDLSLLDGDEFRFGEIVYGEASDDYIMPVYFILKNNGGGVRGFINVNVSVLSFIREIEIGIDLYSLTELIIVCEKHKKLIYNSGSYRMLDDISGKAYFNRLNGKSGYFTIREADENYLYSYVRSTERLRYVPEQWTVLIRNSEAEVTNTFSKTGVQVYSLVFAVFTVLAVFIFLAIRSILRSVENLRSGAKKIGEGDLAYRVPSVSKDEMNDVVVSFNNMADNLVRVMTKKEELEEEVARRVHAEQEVKILNASLEKRVEERTIQLEVSNRELEAFSYSVSHDLRAPLRAIDGFSRMLLEQSAAALDAESKRYLGVIRTSTQNMGKLIDDLLSFSRIGKLEIRCSVIDMASLAEELFAQIAAPEAGRTIDFTIRTEPAVPAITGDAGMMKIVLTNLFSNAVKFTGKRADAKIEFGGSTEGSEAVFFVKDNGAGFDMKYAAKLFDVFQRLHRQDEFEGTGIGLALVRRIVTRHGGRVWAESVLGEHAVFYFSMPMNG